MAMIRDRRHKYTRGRRLRRLLAVGAAPPIAYCALALVLALPRPQSQAPISAAESVLIFACDNGVHVDLVLPVDAGGQNWREFFAPHFYQPPPAGLEYIGLGWGSRDFYLATPEWRDFRPTFALQALLWDETVLHVEFLSRPVAGSNCKQWPASIASYRALVRFVMNSLRLVEGRPLPVGTGYGSRDAFFLAAGRYTPVMTCNQWTGRALATAGAPVGPWTPFSALVAWRLPPASN